MSSAYYRLITKALENYTEQIGVDIAKHPFIDQFQVVDSPDEILRLFEDRMNAFKVYRDGNRKLINWLSPVVQVIHLLSGVLGDAVSLMPFKPSQAIFVAVDVLITAASGVSSSYDALVDLFECLETFLKRLRIYTDVSLTPLMKDIIVQIMVELLSVFALATKQVKQGRLKKFAKKLLGESEIEAVLQRLDRLTREEGRITIAQTLEVVHGLMNNVKVVMNDGKASTDGIRKDLAAMQQLASEMNKIKRDQLQKDSKNWLCPPDPSGNYNIGCEIHRDGTTTWFFRGSVFAEWNAQGSLLWIYGKPGSGKTILLSSIIREIDKMCMAGLASMTYYYFDFRDSEKRRLRGLLSSLVFQLSAQSDAYFQILSHLYSVHAGGSRLPDDNALLQCLVEMLEVQGRPAIYIIIDAIDECPNLSGMPTAREQVLNFLEHLVHLNIPNVHICVSSRAEVDIRIALETLAPFRISLHDEGGQKEDISSYINAVVHSDQRMRKWRAGDKQFVIEALSDRADGMFRWVSCQLEALRRILPAQIRSTLNDMPKTLDETYERALLAIDGELRQYAQRLFHCLAVSIRPLRIEELADILAVRFDAGAQPKFDPDWRLGDAEEAVLSVCSNLISVVDIGGSQVVQFSHFSVLEFLTSNRLASSHEDLSGYHIIPHAAHTILAQASLSVLLRIDDRIDKDSIQNFPLSHYAAQHWVDHGKFEGVSTSIEVAMESLFNPDDSHFSTWVWIYDIDHPWAGHMSEVRPTPPTATPLYYAALCGFRGLVEYLSSSTPRDINARGGYYTTALHAALARGHVDTALSLLANGVDMSVLDDEDLSPLQRAARSGRRDIVELLLGHGANVDVRNGRNDTPLALAASSGELDVLRLLLDRWADVNSRDENGSTPLHLASRYGHLETVWALVQRGADVNAQQVNLCAALHLAIATGNLDVARFLVEHGADIEIRNQERKTPLNLASSVGKLEIVQLLIECNANASSCEENGWTPLHTASQNGHLDVVEKLVERGVDVTVRGENGETPLDLASGGESFQVVRFLVQRGADVNSSDKTGCTPLHAASRSGNIHILRLLLNEGAHVNARNVDNQTPLALASENGGFEVSRLLIERGAEVNSSDNEGWTPLRSASRFGHLAVARLLLDQRADVHFQQNGLWSPLHFATANGHVKIAGLLIQYGADVDGRNKNQETALNLASSNGKLEVVRLLLKCGAKVDPQDNRGWTPLHSALQTGHHDIARLLLEWGANVDLLSHANETPLDLASGDGKHEVSYFLGEGKGRADAWNNRDETSQPMHPDLSQSSLNHERGEGISDNEAGPPMHAALRSGQLPRTLASGADVNERNANHQTPLDVASSAGRPDIVKLLLDSGADVNSRCDAGWTPLHRASQCGQLPIVRLLLDHGAEVNVKEQERWTPLHLASYNGHLEIVQLLLEKGAEVDVRNCCGWTPFQAASAGGHLLITQLLSEYAVRRPTPQAPPVQLTARQTTLPLTECVFMLQILAPLLAYMFRR